MQIVRFGIGDLRATSLHYGGRDPVVDKSPRHETQDTNVHKRTLTSIRLNLKVTARLESLEHARMNFIRASWCVFGLGHLVDDTSRHIAQTAAYKYARYHTVLPGCHS